MATFVEEARRRQIVGCTAELIAERGSAGVSLSAIAAAAGISKAAVLYHFASRDAVLAATAAHVLEAFVADVGGAVDAADGPEAMLLAYLSTTIAHFRAHPAHLRVLADGALGTPAESRTAAVAGIVADGQAAGVFRSGDPRVLAVIVSGALDAVVAQWLADPALDVGAAAAELERCVLRMLRPGAPGPVSPAAPASTRW